MQRSRVLLGTFVLASAALSSCEEEPPVERHYPMRGHEDQAESSRVITSGLAQSGQDGSNSEPTTLDAGKPRERAKPDPAIAETLDLIAASKQRFIDQAEDKDSRPTEYTAEQFASMLRSKWDWIGYDITEPEPWLDEIATRSFKSNLPYLVVLADGSTTEFRGWLDTQRVQAKP
jgi:hypothetical protein